MKTNWRGSITSHMAAGKVIMCTYREWRSKVLQWWERSSLHWFRGITRRRFGIDGADRHKRSIELVRSDGLIELWRLYQERGHRSQRGNRAMGMIGYSRERNFKGMVNGKGKIWSVTTLSALWPLMQLLMLVPSSTVKIIVMLWGYVSIDYNIAFHLR